MTREQFQAEHGAVWDTITKNPAFFAALQVCSTDKLQQISTLSDEQIDAHGKTILAGFRDRLQLENALIDLAVSEHGALFDLPPETYQDNGEQPFVAPEFETTQPPRTDSPFNRFQAAATTKAQCQKKPQQHSKRRRKPKASKASP